jgi:hypothetical protein
MGCRLRMECNTSLVILRNVQLLHKGHKTKAVFSFLPSFLPSICLNYLTFSIYSHRHQPTHSSPFLSTPVPIYDGVSKSFGTESITKYTFTTINTHWEATQRVMAAKLIRLTHKIALKLYLVAESCTMCGSVQTASPETFGYTFLHAYLTTCPFVPPCLSTCLSVCLSICLSIYLSIYLSTYLFLSVCQSINLSVCLHFYISVHLLSVHSFCCLLYSFPIFIYNCLSLFSCSFACDDKQFICDWSWHLNKNSVMISKHATKGDEYPDQIS